MNRFRKMSIYAVCALALFLSASMPLPIAKSASGPIPNLVAYYPFDGNALDLSGNEKHGTIADAVVAADRFGKNGGALFLDGRNDFINFPININPKDMPQLTVTMWCQPEGQQRDVHLITHDNGSYDRTIAINDTDKGRTFSLFQGNRKRFEAPRRTTSNEWIFVAMVYNEETQEASIWINNTKHRSFGSLGWGFHSLRVGINVHSMQFFRGAIDEMQVYHRALNDDEVRRIRTG